MRTPHYQKCIVNSATGSTVRHTSPNRIQQYNFALPIEFNEQESISNFFNSFENKIELLKSQNKTLEEIIQTIYKEWFSKYNIGDFLPDQWRIKKLKECGNIICGKTPPKSNQNYYGNDVPFIKIPDMHNKMFIVESNDNLSLEGANSQMNKMLPKGSICVSCIATVGLVSITTKDSQTNQQINSIIPNSNILTEFLFLKMIEIKDYLKDLGSGGTATLNVNTSTFSNIEIIVPSDEYLLEFHKIINPFFKKINSNLEQIKTLSKKRDSLLPVLYSGNLKIKETKF